MPNSSLRVAALSPPSSAASTTAAARAATATSTATDLLDAWSAGDPAALERLIPVVMDEVRRVARQALLQERADHTLQPTALVNEAYVRLCGVRKAQWNSRDHFFGHLAKLMRRILVDYARHRQAAKRGGGAMTIPLEDVTGLGQLDDHRMIDLDAALTRLRSRDALAADVVQLKFFVGLTLPQIAEVRGVSLTTINRKWHAARLHLARQLRR